MEPGTEIRTGDFIQMTSHFGDIFCECLNPPFTEMGSLGWVTYDKYGKLPRAEWGSGVRRVIQAEMAIPVMLFKRLRFQAQMGQYDPFYGFAPAGTPLRIKGD